MIELRESGGVRKDWQKKIERLQSMQTLERDDLASIAAVGSLKWDSFYEWRATMSDVAATMTAAIVHFDRPE